MCERLTSKYLFSSPGECASGGEDGKGGGLVGGVPRKECGAGSVAAGDDELKGRVPRRECASGSGAAEGGELVQQVRKA